MYWFPINSQRSEAGSRASCWELLENQFIGLKHSVMTWSLRRRRQLGPSLWLCFSANDWSLTDLNRDSGLVLTSETEPLSCSSVVVTNIFSVKSQQLNILLDDAGTCRQRIYVWSNHWQWLELRSDDCQWWLDQHICACAVTHCDCQWTSLASPARRYAHRLSFTELRVRNQKTVSWGTRFAVNSRWVPQAKTGPWALQRARWHSVE